MVSTTKVVKVVKTAKKHAKKKSAVKKEPQRSVRHHAKPDELFILVDGKKIKNIKELADIMGEIEDYVFNHHVNEHNNDFENWLRHVFQEIELAKQVAGCKDKKHVQLVLYRHIAHKLW